MSQQIFKNVASQKIRVYAYADAGHATLDAGEPVTGDAANITAYEAVDNAALGASNDTNPAEVDATNAPGFYEFDPTQAETNGDVLEWYPKSSTAGVQVVVVGGSIIGTVPQYLPDLNIESDGVAHADVKEWLGTAAATPSVAGVPEVDLTHVGGSTTSVSALATNAASAASDLGDFIPATSAVDDPGAAATTTVFNTDLTDADDFWNDALLIFTSGALDGQARPILDYKNTNGEITLSEALTSIPSDNDTFAIVAFHIHPVSQIQSGLATEAKQDIIDGVADDIKTVTDQMVFTTANQLDVQVLSMATDSLTADAAAADFIGASEIAASASQEIANLIAADWIAGDASPVAVATAVWAAATRTLTANTNLNDPTTAQIRDAILDRVLSGNHDTADTPGKLLQDAAAATDLATVDTVVDTIQKLLEADRVIDTGVTPWALVLIEKGTGDLGVGTELLRQQVKDTSDGNITSTGTVVGRLETT